MNKSWGKKLPTNEEIFDALKDELDNAPSFSNEMGNLIEEELRKAFEEERKFKEKEEQAD